MSEQKKYDWADYYAYAYERERKQNNMLAAKIAEAETKGEDTALRLDRIYASPFWKATGPFRKLYQNIRDRGHVTVSEEHCSEGEECLLSYREEMEKQQHRYRQWCIKNSGCNATTVRTIADGMFREGMWITPIEGTDILLCGYGKGVLNQGVSLIVKSWFDKNKTCLLLYGDEDFYDKKTGDRMEPWFKPDYSPDTLLSFNYFGHMIAVRKDLVEKADGAKELLREQKGMEEMEAAADFYNLCLRLEEACWRDNIGGVGGVLEKEKRIGHIDVILFHKEYAAAPTAQDAEKCLAEELAQGNYLVGAGEAFAGIREEALARRGVRATLEGGADKGIYHIVYDVAISGRERCQRAQNSLDGFRSVSPHLLVSVIIPSKDHPELLETCIESFISRTEYGNYEFIVVDNGSSEENRRKAERELPAKLLRKKHDASGKRREFNYTYLYEPMPFNFSKMCNLGAARARGDLLLFLNDDVEIIEKDWLTRMTSQAMQPKTGAVGAKLWYAGTDKIQHAGITNLWIGPSHKLVTFPDNKDYYYGRNRVTYNVAGVTGACLLVSKAKFDEVGGMDESMAVSYNDVDLCFKLIEAGYYNVVRNDAVLIHHESLSRGLDEDNEEKWERLLAEKEALYVKHPKFRGWDPFYNKSLIDNASDYTCNYKFPHENHLWTTKPKPLTSADLRGAKPGALQLTVDRAQKQPRIHREEAEILWIMGWCYVPGADNALYERTLLLQRHDKTGYMLTPEKWHRKDVEEVLPQECNVGLAGFSVRVLWQDLEQGEYRIGMLCTDRKNDQQLLAWSEITVVI